MPQAAIVVLGQLELEQLVLERSLALELDLAPSGELDINGIHALAEQQPERLRQQHLGQPRWHLFELIRLIDDLAWWLRVDQPWLLLGKLRAAPATC
jgi:hypothetical protein